MVSSKESPASLAVVQPALIAGSSGDFHPRVSCKEVEVPVTVTNAEDTGFSAQFSGAIDMITKFRVRSFKSLESVEVELGRVNLFIGANGSGKSNLLEAIGVLGAAADGKVNDQALLQRGVRPGVPALYKSSFHKREDSNRDPSHIFFEAENADAKYGVTLNNPLKDPKPAWRFKHEWWESDREKFASRSPNTSPEESLNPEQGLAALRAVEHSPTSPPVKILKTLQNYVIYTPTTAVLRGTMTDPQQRTPLGLSGGRLSDALLRLLKQAKAPGNADALSVLKEARSLIGWAKSVGSGPASKLPLSPSVPVTGHVIRFIDRFMSSKRNVLSGYDASEGALYVLFLAVLAAHQDSPALCAVDNADHGLNPRLARSLMSKLCGWYLNAREPRQLLMTTHNPLVLDGLNLENEQVRLFSVARTSSGRTSLTRVQITPERLALARQRDYPLSRLWVMGHLGGLEDV